MADSTSTLENVVVDPRILEVYGDVFLKQEGLPPHKDNNHFIHLQLNFSYERKGQLVPLVPESS